MGAGGEVLGAGLNPLDGPTAGLAGSQGAEGHVGIVGNLDAETTADVMGLDSKLVNANAQRRRQELNGKSREGVVAPEVDAVVLGVPLGDDGIVFQRSAGETMEVQVVDVDNIGGLAKRFVNIAVVVDSVPDHVGAGSLVEDTFVLEGGFGVQHGLQCLIFDLNQLGRILGHHR